MPDGCGPGRLAIVPLALLLAAAAPAPGAPTPSTGLWTELREIADPPEQLQGAHWFRPAPARLLELRLEPGATPTVWRVETGAEGQPLSRVEQRAEPVGEGRFLLWVSPAPAAAWAVVTSGGGRVRAATLGALDDPRLLARAERLLWRWAAHPDAPVPRLPAFEGADRWARHVSILRDRGPRATAALRRALLLARLELLDPGSAGTVRGRAPGPRGSVSLEDGEALPLSARGPGLLRLDTWATARGEAPPTPVPYDVVLTGTDGAATARLPTGARIPAESADTAARRRLTVPVPSGDRAWMLTVRGSDADLEARFYRARPPFPRRPDGPRMTALARAAGDDAGDMTTGSHLRADADGRADALASLGAGRWEEARAATGRWLQAAPDDDGALVALARLQARVAPLEGVVPPALPTLEVAIQRRDRDGLRPAPDALRDAARDAWLQATAYGTTGVLAPASGDGDAPDTVLIQALPALHPLAEVGDDGRHRDGVFTALPADRGATLRLPAHPLDPSRWTVVEALGLNLTGEPAVIALSLDDAPPRRVLLANAVTPLRLALPSGTRVVRVDAPQGAGPRVALLIDVPPDARGGPWGEAFPHVRRVPTTAVEPGGSTGRFQLAEGGPIHLRLELWWTGATPRTLTLRTADEERALVVYPGARPPALVPGQAAGADALLSSGEVSIDLPAGTRWFRLRDDGGQERLWVRALRRGPRPHTVAAHEDAPVADDPAGPAASARAADPADDLVDLTRKLSALAPGDPTEATLRVERAERLLAHGVAGYALRDLRRARLLPGAPPGIDRVEARARAAAGPAFVVIHDDGARGPFAFSPEAALGAGPAAWLRDLPADDLAHAVAEQRWLDAAAAAPDTPAFRRALALDAFDRAAVDPGAAVEALVHAAAVRERVDDDDSARVARRARAASRPDLLATALESPDRVFLRGPRAAAASGDDPDGWARGVMLGASLPWTDALIAAGSRWVARPGDAAPTALTLHASCDDLRDSDEAGDCQLGVAIGDRAPIPWTVPRGRPASLPLTVRGGETLAVALAAEGRARYAALALVADDASGWRIAEPGGWYHVAHPGQPVVHELAGPTLLTVELTPRCGADGTVAAAIRLDGDPRAEPRWTAPAAAMRSDQGIAYGARQRLEIGIDRPGIHRLVVDADGGPVAVRVTRRVPAEPILPEAPPGVGLLRATRGDDMLAPPVAARSSGRGIRLQRPAAVGTVDTSLRYQDRWSTDQDLGDARHRYVELQVLHRVRIGARDRSWFYGGALGRFGFLDGPSGGLRIGTLHCVPRIGLRLSGEAQGLLQQADAGLLGALAMHGRIDRPTRLAPALTLVPFVTLRGHVQPGSTLDWYRGRVDLEIASSYRRAHPFGVGGGAQLGWRPWIDGEWVAGVRGMSNPDGTPDHAGASVELRLHPRPLTLAVRFDLSRRFADDWRPDAWWRAQLELSAWADLGPPELWIRPELRASYLLEPSRLELTFGVAVIPGRRATVHVPPTQLPMRSVRHPLPLDGRWRR